MPNPPKAKPHWHLTFDLSPDLSVKPDGSSYHVATAVAQHGEFAYMAEIPLQNWAQDIVAFFTLVRSAYFQAESNGMPEFPDMGKIDAHTSSQTAEPAQPEEEPAEQDETLDDSSTAEYQEEAPCSEYPVTPIDDDYAIDLYPAAVADEAILLDTEQPGPDQPSLF